MRATMRVAWEFLSGVKLRRAAFASLVLSLFFHIVFSAAESVGRFLRFEEVAETLRLFADGGLSTIDTKDSTGWNDWVRTRDAEVRARGPGRGRFHKQPDSLRRFVHKSSAAGEFFARVIGAEVGMMGGAGSAALAAVGKGETTQGLAVLRAKRGHGWLLS